METSARRSGRDQTPKNLPVDLSTLNNVLFPLAPTLLPNNVHDFYLANRVDVLTTMVEGKVLHNSPAAGVLYKEMDAKVNKWLGSVAGVPINAASATFLRCEFGVLPSQLVAERSALYYLWHLRSEFLPALQHLPPVAGQIDWLAAGQQHHAGGVPPAQRQQPVALASQSRGPVPSSTLVRRV